MSKYLKSLLIAGLVVCMTVCLGIFAAACNNNDDGDKGDDTFPSSVNVTVMLDESTPASVMVQLCAVEDNGELGLCLSPVATNAQGVATISIDKENGKQYEIHLLGVPDGYTYVDGLGTAYLEGSGLRIDVTKNASVTITLKATVVTTHTLTLNEAVDALSGHTYVFTAPESGYYNFTVTVPEGGVKWNLNGNQEWGDEKLVQLNKDATATVEIFNSCTLKVVSAQAPDVGTADNPLALTVGGNAENFSVDLEEFIDKQGQPDSAGNMPTYTTWNDSRYANFTTDKAGKYKFTFTFGLSGDEVAISANAGNNFASLSESGSTTNGMYLIYAFDNAETEYTVRIDTNVDDYATLVTDDTTSLNYSVKVEYIVGSEPTEGDNEGNTNEITLSLGSNNIPSFHYETPHTYIYNGTANATYTVTVSLAAGDWSVNGGSAILSQSTTVTADANGLVSFTIGWENYGSDESGAFTLTLTLAE